MSNAHAVHSISSLETDIVIDLGCCSYQRGNQLEDSIQTLVKRFSPHVLFGFDPHPGLQEGVGKVHGTTVLTSRRAAWTRDGKVGLEINGNCTHVDESAQKANCFNIAAFVRSLPPAKTVLKIDVEGAEYVLLPFLVQHELLDRFTRILVEWHTGQYANGFESDRERILSLIKCPIEEWK